MSSDSGVKLITFAGRFIHPCCNNKELGSSSGQMIDWLRDIVANVEWINLVRIFWVEEYVACSPL